jgi:hypothetical protein
MQYAVIVPLEIAASEELDMISRSCSQTCRSQNSRASLRHEIEKVGRMRKVEPIAGLGEQEQERIGNQSLACAAQHEQALHRMERSRKNNDLPAHPTTCTSQRLRTIKIEGIEFAVLRALDKHFLPDLDVAPMLHLYRCTGMSASAPTKSRET